jgi:hypothetical protein
MDPVSRDIPIDRDHAALLLIDVQNYKLRSRLDSAS